MRLARLRVSLPVAVIVKFFPAAELGTVNVMVSLLLPVYPLTEAPDGSAEVLSVYPLLILVSFT